MTEDREEDVPRTPSAYSGQDRQRVKELTRQARYQEAMRRLDQAVEAAAGHIKVESDPHDYDDAVVERPCPTTSGRR
jgi:hypothetical protein